MTVTFNPTLVGKLLNRALDPASAPNEVLVALRKIRDHFHAANMMPSEALVVDKDYFFAACALPEAGYRNQIADLEIAVVDAQDRAQEERETAQALREKLTVKQAAAERLGEELASVREAYRRLAEETAALRTRIETADQTTSPVAPVTADEADSSDTKIVDLPNASAPNEPAAPAGTASRAEETRWKDGEWLSFVTLASAGFTKQTIASKLSRLWGYVVSVGMVSEMMWTRWSASSGERYALSTF